MAALVAAAVVFRVQKMSTLDVHITLFATATQPPMQARTTDVARALGAINTLSQPDATAAPQSSRFILTGVIAAASRQGTALISVDGKPARPFAVGAQIDDAWSLSSVQQRQATLVQTCTSNTTGSGAPELVLDIPASTKNSTELSKISQMRVDATSLPK